MLRFSHGLRHRDQSAAGRAARGGRKDGVLPLPRWLMSVLNVLINLRSIPFLILMIMVFPLSRLIIGTTVGTRATIVPLVIAAFPFVARLVESSLRELDQHHRGRAEHGRDAHADHLQGDDPREHPSLLQNFTIALTTILGYSAMSGIIGGGGLARSPSTTASTATNIS